jgi:hypothetical protein
MALDLRLDTIPHVDGGPVRDMAVRPGGVLAAGSARVVEQALLGEQDERALGMASLPGRTLRLRNLGRPR